MTNKLIIQSILYLYMIKDAHAHTYQSNKTSPQEKHEIITLPKFVFFLFHLKLILLGTNFLFKPLMIFI